MPFESEEWKSEETVANNGNKLKKKGRYTLDFLSHSRTNVCKRRKMMKA